jgi:hypothetical protein
VRRESLTPSERVLRARMAAYALHARCDSRETTKPARRAFNARFLDQVDPERRLPEYERQRRAEAAKKAYFTKLALPVGAEAAGEFVGAHATISNGS